MSPAPVEALDEQPPVGTYQTTLPSEPEIRGSASSRRPARQLLGNATLTHSQVRWPRPLALFARSEPTTKEWIMPPTTSPYGSWASPITTDSIVADSVGLGQIALDGDDVYWVEVRPLEAGRQRGGEADSGRRRPGRHSGAVQRSHPCSRVWRWRLYRLGRDGLLHQLRRSTGLPAAGRARAQPYHAGRGYTARGLLR